MHPPWEINGIDLSSIQWLRSNHEHPFEFPDLRVTEMLISHHVSLIDGWSGLLWLLAFLGILLGVWMWIPMT
jgi:hypothetical protein